MKSTFIFTLLLGFVLCGCKEAGDTIENKSGADIEITLTTLSGEIRKEPLGKGVLLAMPRWKDDTSLWRFYKIEVSDKSGRQIGVMEVNSDLRRKARRKYLDIVVFQDRLVVDR